MDKSAIKIIGNTTTTSMPRSDWNQIDDTKADFILNKPNPVLSTEQQLTDDEKTQARQNISAASEKDVNLLSEAKADKKNAVYILQAGETLDDVPDDYSIAMNPNEDGGEFPEGGDVQIDETLTQSGMAADAAVVGQKFAEQSEAIVDLKGGMNATAKSLLITILRNGVYTSDQSANITALENALNESGGDDDTDTGGVTQMGSVLYITGGVTATQIGTALKIA